jgi:thioredoxin-dependent peroxiredoxin
MRTLTVGDVIPGFTLADQHGRNFNINDYRGKKLVIYFYPKNESPACTKEACAFRDSFSEFKALGAIVIGINSGTVESHRKFAEHHRLPFTLLSDPDNRVLKSFGIKPVLFLTGRETFVVDENGKIVYTYRAFLDGKSHPQSVISFLRS